MLASPIMDRRDFVRIVITGSLASSLGCRARGDGHGSSGTEPAAGEPGGRPAPGRELSAEINAWCHAVRDGAEVRTPRPSRHLPVVIVGGGAAGLMAARTLGDRPYLLLEKEPTAGGNATGDAWRGVGYSTGTSYNSEPIIREVAAELGVPLRSIESLDGMIVRDILVPEFFGDGLRRAPYPQTVRDAFRRYLDTYQNYDVDGEVDRLDNLPFGRILGEYPKEISDFFDSYGPNNWGARVQDTSAYIGIQAARWLGGRESSRFTGDRGFGEVTQALADRIGGSSSGRLIAGATVVRIERDGARVLVAYVPPDEGVQARGGPAALGSSGTAAAPRLPRLECVSADAVVMAAPKLIAKYIVAGLPQDQQEAMSNFRYAPYMVANLCFDGVVHDSCFDVNVPAPDLMSDFVCADWVRLRGRGVAGRPTVLTCYMPQFEENRDLLLDEERVRALALRALQRIDRWFPGAAAKCREIRVRLRGHPMHLAACGMITKWAPLARRSFGPIHFAGTDIQGEVSDFGGALETGRRAAQSAIDSVDAAHRRGAALPAGRDSARVG
jgi:flavin-dependent amine oxidoreductase